MSRIVIAALLLAALVGPVDARRYAGSWSNAFTAVEGPLRFRGRLTEGMTSIRGQVKCRNCPVRGRLQLTCVDGFCTGTLSNGCTAEGYYYRTHLEGTYDCGGNPVGVLAFGPR
ncbi:MAG TPA: hypothetical protein VGR62_14315 [Candidatus Binatia bacterium]|jgi:hypothetical protein|nr:hypothetical protein [Candidatus Binatia bacterium]